MYVIRITLADGENPTLWMDRIGDLCTCDPHCFFDVMSVVVEDDEDESLVPRVIEDRDGCRPEPCSRCGESPCECAPVVVLATRLATHRHPCWQEPDPCPPHGTPRGAS